MRVKEYSKFNDDPEMQPIVCENHGPDPMRFTSILHVTRPDLVERQENSVFVVHPGRRVIIPHGYFEQLAMGKRGAKVTFHLGARAPELKGYKCAYQMRALARPWYKKFSDFFLKG